MEEKFVLKEEHINLLKRMNVDWSDCEFGAPRIDPKRPYGNSCVYTDMIESLGWQNKIINGKPLKDHEGEYPTEIISILDKLHNETRYALQIVLTTGSFIQGIYIIDKDYKWRLLK